MSTEPTEPTEPTGPSAQTARELLQEAGRLGAASRAGASWPHIAMLLGLGAISSLSLLSFWLVGQFNESLIALPMMAMLVWLAIFMGFMLANGRTTKLGFTRRWMTFMGIWAGLWILGTVVGLVFFPGSLWFFIAISTAITANSVIGAWREVRA